MPINLDEVSYTFEVPKLDKVPDDRVDEVLKEVGEYLLDSILDYVGSSSSPVSGGSFKKSLSPEYAKASGKKTADLDLNGSMLDSLKFITDTDSGAITIGIFDSEETPKAYNHNVGQTLPKRQFIPNEDQNFKREILRGVSRIVEEYIDEQE
jgi:hypothetical protein